MKINYFGAKNILFFVFGCVLIVLLSASLIRNSNNSSSISFTSFLEYLSNSPDFSLSVSISDFRIVADWGFFNSLRDFFNIFTVSFGFIVWFFTSVVNCLIYAFYFLRFLLVI